MPANEREPLIIPSAVVDLVLLDQPTTAASCRTLPCSGTSGSPTPRSRAEAGSRITPDKRATGRCRATDRAAASSSLHVRTLEGTREHRLPAGTRGRAAVAARVVARAGAVDAVVDGTRVSRKRWRRRLAHAAADTRLIEVFRSLLSAPPAEGEDRLHSDRFSSLDRYLTLAGLLLWAVGTGMPRPAGPDHSTLSRHLPDGDRRRGHDGGGTGGAVRALRRTRPGSRRRPSSSRSR